MPSDFGPIADKWSRRPARSHVVCGVDLARRRNASCLFLFAAVVSAAVLTSRYRLEHPDDHPYGHPTSIGKQAYAVSFKKAVAGQTTLSSEPVDDVEDYAAGDNTWDSVDNSGDWESDDDWLAPTKPVGWDPLYRNTAPLTEITIKSCVLPPGFYDLCAPTSSKKEDALRGKWVRVDRDLNRRVGIYYLYLYERRLLPNSQAAVITDVKLLTHSPTADDLSAGGMWTELSDSIRTGVWPRMPAMFLHYKVTEQSDVRAARKASTDGSAGALEPITEFDVVYGGDEVQPLYGYEIVPTYITGGPDDKEAAKLDATDNKGRVGSRLAVRRAPVALPATPVLRFTPEGKFNILQVADLHFSVGPGACRNVDPERESECKKVGADKYSLDWLETAIDTTKPDLVVFSGDQLNGQDTSWSSQSGILKWAPTLWSRQIPWTVIFGNHDGELDLSLEDQMTLMKSMPYFVGQAGPSNVDGTGNYVKPIRSADTSNTTLFNLYFLDTHAIAKSLNPWEKGYDWLKASQINWFKGQSSRVKSINRPYQPKAGSTNVKGSAARPSRPKTKPGKKPAKPKPVAEAPKEAVAAPHIEATAPPATAPELSTVDFLGHAEDVSGGADPVNVPPIDALPDDNLNGFADAVAEKLGEPTPAELAAMTADDSDVKKKRQTSDDELNQELGDIGAIGDDAAVPEGLGSEGSLGAAVMPDDGSNVADGPMTDSDVPNEGDNPTSEELESAFGDLFDDAEPTVLPAGPTKAKPMEAKPNAISFLHIPLPEVYDAPIDIGMDGKRLVTGERFEGRGAPKFNSGFFTQALLAQGELVKDASEDSPDEFWEGEFSAPTTGRPEVKVVANGHCHITEDCRRVKGVWMCFGGGGSYSGYGRAGFARRMRVYEVSEYGEKIETYKLLDTKKKIDQMVLAGTGAVGESA
ncbi:phosphatase dcr2 [Pseudohyphozyma bogoriensis]|nr:phosphatase dcr2 [Pseudohyphozyma bogoriensis]